MAKAKSAKKTASTKRTPVKKTAAKTPKGIPAAPEEFVFVLVDGRRLRDIKELADSLDGMEDHIYSHHVNAQRNDFAQWIADIFRDMELSREVRESHNKHHAQIVLYRNILDRL